MRSEVSEIPIKTTIAFIYQPRGLFFPGQYLSRSVQLKLTGKPPRRTNEAIHLRRNKHRVDKNVLDARDSDKNMFIYGLYEFIVDPVSSDGIKIAGVRIWRERFILVTYEH